MSDIVYTSEERLQGLVDALPDGPVYAAVQRRAGCVFARLEDAAAAASALRQARPVAGPKALLHPARQRVAGYSLSGDGADGAQPEVQPHVLFGIRPCDLRAIAYLDKVLLGGDFRDPFYAATRKAQMLVSVDCVESHESCFCTAVGGKPFAEAGFDLNLTPVDGGFLVEAGSDAGRAVLERAAGSVSPATDAQLTERDSLRRRMTEAVLAQTQGLERLDAIQAALLRAQESGRGLEATGECVECAACTFICPTCYCFYLHDRAAGDGAFDRLRTWDSCILADYSRMAGPPQAKPTPRPRLRSRFANRLLHKFAFGPAQTGLPGCVGCGRCIEACLGHIDIRQVLREVSRDQRRA